MLDTCSEEVTKERHTALSDCKEWQQQVGEAMPHSPAVPKASSRMLDAAAHTLRACGYVTASVDVCLVVLITCKASRRPWSHTVGHHPTRGPCRLQCT